MKKYTVVIEEITTDEFEVEATTEKEALELARQKYREGKIVLEPGKLLSARVAIIKPEVSLGEWLDIY